MNPLVKTESEASTEQIQFCKEKRKAFSLREGINEYLRNFPVNIRRTRCSINPNQPYGYETEPFLIDFKEETWGGRRLIFWRFEIRQRALYCNGARGEWKKIDDVVFQEDPDSTSDKVKEAAKENRKTRFFRLGNTPTPDSTPTISRVNAGDSVFGITEDPEISGKQFEAKIRARIDALGSSISTTTIHALTSFSNNFKVEKGTILHRDQLPAELFGAHSGLNNHTYFEIVDFTTTSGGSKWDGTSFDVPVSNIRIQTTVMTVKPSSSGRDGSPNFGNYSRQQAIDRISSGLKSSVSSSITAPGFVRDVSSSKSSATGNGTSDG